MAKRCALYFGAAGSLLVIWYYGFAFARQASDFAARLLNHSCFTCMEPVAAGWRAPVLYVAPITGLVYAALGFIVGKGIEKYKASYHTNKGSGGGDTAATARLRRVTVKLCSSWASGMLRITLAR